MFFDSNYSYVVNKYDITLYSIINNVFNTFYAMLLNYMGLMMKLLIFLA